MSLFHHEGEVNLGFCLSLFQDEELKMFSHKMNKVFVP